MKNKNKYLLLLIVILVIMGILIPNKTTYESKEYKKQQVEEIISEPVEMSQVPPLYPKLKRICSCESTGKPDNEPRQFNVDGTVLRGVINSKDTGMCQINTFYHGESAEKMGLDLETKYGNAVYANWLFDTQGSTPWGWSSKCWSK